MAQRVGNLNEFNVAHDVIANRINDVNSTVAARCNAVDDLTRFINDNSWMSHNDTRPTYRAYWEVRDGLDVTDQWCLNWRRSQPVKPSTTTASERNSIIALIGIANANNNAGGSSNNLRHRAENFCSSKNGTLSSFNQYNFNCAERGPMGSVNYGSYNTNILR